MRTNLLFISSLLWLFTFTSVAADSKPQQHAVSQQQSETIYGQIFAMQNRLGQLEAGLQQQQGHFEDLKDAEKELQILKVQLARLELQLSSQKEVQSNELTAVSTRVSDAQTNMNWLLGMIGVFLTLLTLMLAFVGFLTYQRSKDAALQQIRDFLQKEKPKLLEGAKTDILRDAELEIEVVRKQLTHDFTQKWEVFLEPLQKQAEQFFNREKLNSTHDPENELSDEQKRQLAFATTLKPESEFTAKDWYNRSTSQLVNGDYIKALGSIEQALADETNLTDLELANYLRRKAMCFYYLKDTFQTLSVYNLLISKFSDTADSDIQKILADAMFGKGVSQGKQSLIDDEIASYDNLIDKFGDSKEVAIQERVASAFCNKGVCLGRLNKYQSAMSVYDEVIAKFDNSTEPTVLEKVYRAMANQAETALLIEQPADVLRRIIACESKTIDPETLAVMHFLRFIINDKTISELLGILNSIPEGTELKWSFDEIKPFIEQNFSDNKLHQCKAVIAFFEEHNNFKKLETELSKLS